MIMPLCTKKLMFVSGKKGRFTLLSFYHAEGLLSRKPGIVHQPQKKYHGDGPDISPQKITFGSHPEF